MLLATAPCAVPNHTVPDRFGGWSLINNPIFTLLCLPSPQSTRHPLPVPAEGLPRSGPDQRSVQRPRVGREPLGWHMASRHHTAMPPRCWAVLAGSRQRGGGDRSAMYLAGNVLCLLPEWLLPAAPWQHQGCSVREKNQPHQKHSLPDRLQTAVVITRKSLGPSTTASNFWF